MRLKHVATAAALLHCLANAAHSHDVHLSLNVFPTNNAAPNSGGTWGLYARTDSPNGIAGMFVNLSGINPNNLTFASNINADPTIANPAIFPGGVFHIVYGQDLLVPPLVFGVGHPTFSPDADQLGESAFANMTKILSGTYNSAIPTFVAYSGAIADSNVFRTSGPTFTGADDANTTFGARTALSGDYNHSVAVDAADYIVWRKPIAGLALINDDTPGVSADDYTR